MMANQIMRAVIVFAHAVVGQTGGLLQEELFDAFPRRAPNGDSEPQHLNLRPGRWQITETIEDQPADSIDPVGFQLEAEMLGKIIEAGIAAHE